jgi:hypothetical protein
LAGSIDSRDRYSHRLRCCCIYPFCGSIVATDRMGCALRCLTFSDRRTVLVVGRCISRSWIPNGNRHRRIRMPWCPLCLAAGCKANAAGGADRLTRPRLRVCCALAIAHAALVFWFWYAAMFLDKHLIDTTPWLMMGWSWLFWVAVLAPRARHEAKLVFPTLLAGLGFMIPCISTIYTFSVWALP